MGLNKADVQAIYDGHNALMDRVMETVIDNNGFAWPLLSSRAASLDLADPRPKCAAYMRRMCKPGVNANMTMLFEFTRKTFHDVRQLNLPSSSGCMECSSLLFYPLLSSGN